MKSFNREYPTFAALAAVTAFAAWLRFHALGQSGLWLDEILTQRAVAGGLRHIVQQSMNDTGPLPMAYFFPWLATLWGRSDLLLRLPDALFGTLTVALAGFTAWRLGRSRMAGLAAAALLAVSEHHIYYSREARGYGLLAFLALLSFLALIEGFETGRRRWWFVFAFACIAGQYTSYFFGFTLAGLGAFGVGWIAYSWLRRDLPAPELRRRSKWFFASLLAAPAAFVPWLAGAWATFLDFQIQRPAAGSSPYVARWLSEVMAAWLPAQWGWAICAGGLLLLGDWLMIPRRRGLLTLAAAAPTALAALYFSYSTAGHFLAARYAIASLPIVSVGAGLGLAGIVEIGRRLAKAGGGSMMPQGARVFATAAIALLFLDAQAQLPGYFERATMQKQDWRGALAVLEKNLKPIDRIVPGVDGTDFCLDYYLPARMTHVMASGDWGTPGKVLEATDLAAKHGLRIWYIAPSYALDDTPGLADWLDEHYSLVAELPGSQSEISMYLGPKDAASAEKSKQDND